MAAHLLMNSTAEGAEEHVLLVKNVVMMNAKHY
jgi:hypothetical protein